MKIDKKMNVVIPLGNEKTIIDPGSKKPTKVFVPYAYVHATPISREVFERYYAVIARTFSQVYEGGVRYAYVAGPRVAYLTLRDVAMKDDSWDGADGVENGLMAEIKRLANVLVLAAGGWEIISLHEAITTGAISEDDRSEVENALVFFILVSSMHRKTELDEALDGLSSLWGAQITSSNSTEYRASLQTSTAIESSGEKAGVSSVPS